MNEKELNTSTFSNTFESLSLFKPIHTVKEFDIKKNFEEFIDIPFNDFHLCLSRFSVKRPLKYVNHNLITELYGFLEANSVNFKKSIIESKDVINDSVFSLLRKGSFWGKEYGLDISTPRKIEEFETIWHPEYVRLFESIYKKLLLPIIKTIDKKEKSNFEKTNEKNQSEKLEDLNLNELLKGNNRVIRNSISHGKVSYDYSQIIYNDRHTTEQHFPSDLLRTFDSLAETCNSIVVTYILLLARFYQSDKKIVTMLPLSLKFLFMDGLLSSDYFELLSFHESIVNGSPQLNTICKINSTNRTTHVFYSLNLSYSIFKHVDTNYGRFAISLECGKPIPSSIFIDGKKLKKSIKNNLSIDASKDVIETSMLWHDSNNIRRKIANWRHILKIQYRIYKIERQKELRQAGFRQFSKRFEIKEIENRSTEKDVRIYSHVWIKDIDDLDIDNFHRLVKHIIKSLRRKRFSLSNFGELSKIKYHPKYIWLDIYSQDKCIRFYKRHLNSDYHVLKAEWIKNIQRREPILLKETDAIIGKVRYKYNKDSKILNLVNNEKNNKT
ncbi:hypothetical protein [Polaribacter uvawellassae]|uniref:hypothetical protein n=1 Tax=Polaribacter uvawellassae TaxID=3133495 RepID=UPI00321975D0